MLARLATATLVFAALMQTISVRAAPPNQAAAERLALRNARYAREREVRRRPDRGEANEAPERVFGAARREGDVEVVYYADVDDPIVTTSDIGYAYAAPPLVFPTWSSYGFGWGRPYYVGWYAPFYGGFYSWGYRGCWHGPWAWSY